MTNQGCYCAGPTPNTGVSTCPPIIAKANGIFMIPTYANDGTLNTVDLPALGGSAIDVNALIQNVDPSKRWYPINNIDNVVINRTDDVERTSTGGNTQKVRDGVYEFEFDLFRNGVSAKEIGNIKNMECNDWSIAIITIDGMLVMQKLNRASQILTPISIKGFSANGMFATDEAKADGKIKFNLDNEFIYGTLYQTNTVNINLKQAKGLINAYMIETVGATSTQVVVSVTDDFEQNGTSANVTGLLASDFAMKNNTTGASITITTVNEATDYHYTIVYPTTSDAYTLTIVPSSGYEASIVLTP